MATKKATKKTTKKATKKKATAKAKKKKPAAKKSTKSKKKKKQPFLPIPCTKREGKSKPPPIESAFPLFFFYFLPINEEVKKSEFLSKFNLLYYIIKPLSKDEKEKGNSSYASL